MKVFASHARFYNASRMSTEVTTLSGATLSVALEQRPSSKSHQAARFCRVV